MTTEHAPEASDATLQRVEEVAQRVQRSLLAGIEGVLLRQLPTVLEHTRSTLLETIEGALSRQANLLTAQLKSTLLDTVEELEKRRLEPFLERLKQTLFTGLAEFWEKNAPLLLTRLRESLDEALREGLKRQVDAVVAGVREGVREGAEFAHTQGTLLLAQVREALTEPVARAAREDFPEYARWLGGRVIDYTRAATVFCVAAIFLMVGGVQGLQQAGMPPYLTYFLGGLAGMAAGLIFLRLPTWTRKGKPGHEQPSADKASEPRDRA
ncbi:MAG TPA: hypothetical protein VEL76_18490 [Gemmataceae bacterium]|nr:hypothetical protein [Gemmataceae bacterium]